MADHLLHIDSSIQRTASVSRALTARAAAAWRAAHPDGAVTYRDLGAEALPHLDCASGLARRVAPEEHTPAQAKSLVLTQQLIAELVAADTVVLGLPLYNYGPPSTVKAWVDHLIAPGLSVDTSTMTGLLGGRDVVVIATRGGGYGPGTPREGWDHAAPWLTHALSVLGLEPQVIVAELTQANSVPEMSELRPLAAESLANAERAIDLLWTMSAARSSATATASTPSDAELAASARPARARLNRPALLDPRSTR